MGIVNLLPDSPKALEAIPYFGAKGVEKYGLEILGIIRKYMAENQGERTENEQKKEEKKNTKLISYEMFLQGMNIDEIAKSRDLVSGTIAGHLEHYVRLGKIKVEQVVKAENIMKIRKYLDEHEYMGIFAIKVALGDDVSYADIKFVLAASGH